MFYLFLADGFEEIEALATVDVLRRADVPVLTVGTSGKYIVGAHGVTVEADIDLNAVEPHKMEGIVLPGGMPGTTNLDENKKVSDLIDFAAENDLWLCAICAAPLILGQKGILAGKKATCYPGFESYLKGAILSNGVCRDGKIITANGPGAALPFSFEILNALGKDSEKLKKDMQYV